MAGEAKFRKISIRGKVHRIINSKFPSLGVFDTKARPEDLAEALEVAAMTDPLVRQELRILRGIPLEEWVTGSGSSPLMNAFCHPNEDGTRFADSTYGVYYAAGSVQTAILETVFHRERFLRTAVEPVAPHSNTMRRYECHLGKSLHRITRRSHPDLLSPSVDGYGPSQAFGRSLRDQGSSGLHYPSVRDPEGWCVAVFCPTAVKLPVKAVAHYEYRWDGERLTVVSELGRSYYVSGG